MAAGRRKKGKGGRRTDGRGGLNFLLFVLLVAVTGFVAGYLMFFSPARRAKAPGQGVSPAVRDTGQAGKTVGGGQAAVGLPKPSRPRVAVIIDDVGMDMAALERVGSLGVPVAVAVLPGLRHTADAASYAKEAGIELLLHLPMQPKGDSMKGLGPGALLAGMTDEELRAAVSGGIESVPGAVGVNNHMGSALTEDARAMGVVMREFKRRGLYFVDSRTSAESVALDEASKMGVRAASRAVFLDDSGDPAEIRKQLARLARKAGRDGSALAIGHPRPATLEVLAEELPRLKAQGVDVVRVSDLVR